MMKGNRMSFMLGICTLLLCISCKKSVELAAATEEQSGTETLSTFSSSSGLRIKTIAGWSSYDSTIATFSYNASGNPDSIIFSASPYYGRYNMHFRYDSLNRITDYYTVYSGSLFYEWYRYQYDSSGRPTHDTLYRYGVITAGGPASPTYKLLVNNAYDSLHRVTSTTTTMLPAGTPVVEPYPYNANGNLVRSYLPNVFDTATSLVSIHPVWQLVAKDYSINNQFVAEEYNDAGLPVRVHFGQNQGVFRFLTNNWPSTRVWITYE